jgi:hypothetical protein
VTLKAVNEALASLGAKTELAKGAGYFLFRGGETDDWLDRTVAVPAIGSLTLEQWLDEYRHLKALNEDMMKAAKQPAPAVAKAQKQHQKASAPQPHKAQTRETPNRKAATPASQPREAPARDATRGEPCILKTKLLLDLDQAHKDLAAIEDQQLRAAKEGRISDLITLSASATNERSKFDRALFAVRDHALVHGC